MPALYLVATPIGNLEDITLRALRVLGEVALIAAEDTRRTRLLLQAHGIKARLVSYHDHNKTARLPAILEALRDGDVALVSEAGSPGINDPGYELVVAAVARGIPVVPVPGPSVVIPALTASGLPTNQFLYLGFLPRQPGARRRLLESVAAEPRTLVLLEAPHRLHQTLAALREVLGDRRVAVARELTKYHEEVFRGLLSQAQVYFREPRGEFALVIEGKQPEAPAAPPDLVQRLASLKQQGLSARAAVSRLAQETGLPRRQLYRAWLQLPA